MSTLLKASVVVVTWNGLHHLKQCLPALIRQRGISYEVILVDNGSTDGSVEWVAQSYPDVVLVELGSNHGFAAANNAGFRKARTDLIATLNNDARPDPDWLASLVNAADAHPEAGSFASRVVLTNDPSILDSTGITTDVLGIAWNRHSTDPVGLESEGEVFGACAAAALYRKHLLETLGGFDSTYFAYLEDVDLAWRARWMGWKARYVPSARVTHTHSATAGIDSDFKTFHLGRNKIWTIVKNHHGPLLIALLPLAIAYDLASLPITCLRQRSLVALRARISGLLHIAPALKARKEIGSARRISWHEMQPFVHGPTWPWRLWNRQRRLRRATSGSDHSGRPSGA